MKAIRSMLQISLTLASATFLLAAPVSAQQGPVLDLDYGGQTHCLFQTTNGVNVSGTNAGVITAVGIFGSGCPSAVGGVTGQAAVVISANPATVAVGNPATIAWHGVGDICHYEGSSPQVAGWPSSGVACLGASECAAGGQFTHTFVNGGGTQFAFNLSCSTGVNPEQPTGSTDTGTATVTVTGGTPPPSSTCVAPAGLTRQLTGTISRPSTADVTQGADLTSWPNTFGWYFYTTGDHYTWPGVYNNNLKFYIQEQHYIALEFTVPNDFPFYDGVGYDPYGSMNQNSSWIHTGPFTVTISKDCGDFDQPAVGTPEYYCYSELSGSLGAMTWAVRPLGSPIIAGCPLERGETYFLNITPAPLGQPTQQEDDCQSNICKFNLNNGGNFSAADYDLIP